MPELSAPLRVTWDLPPDPSLVSTLAGRLLEARVLFVDILLGLEGGRGIQGLAAPFAAGAPKLTLTGAAGDLRLAWEVLGPELLARTDLHLLPPYPPAAGARALAAGAASLSPALWSTPAGLGALADALTLADRLDFPYVAIINPPAPAPPLTEPDRRAAKEVWRASSLAGKVALRVHDLFLAEALGLDPFRVYAGCQAAAYLAHVGADGRLAACRTLPEDLGDLAATPLTELWASEARQTLRGRLGELPAPCCGCRVSAACGGGCRGLSERLGRDPSCPGPKEPAP